jgi:hypothetical protein
MLIASTVISAAAAVQQGRAAKAAGDANAQIQRHFASDALLRGAAEEQDMRLRTAGFMGEQAAAFGASGAEINTGSSLDILGDTAELGELDALRIRNNAQREAYAHLSGAAISEAEGDNAQTSGYLNAAGTLIGGASQVSGKWNIYKKDNPGSTFGDFLGLKKRKFLKVGSSSELNLPEYGTVFS